ncbi:nitroreductase family protein [Paenibacillus hamazuiensis]|uniref:nitroreductase family protein n=1 Tax=Paenibacillus hamazuiensis TaxID=2936508 RepID=UPI00200F7A42|nr:nitroreductase [Paenibacillus hamazuiensis]
MSEHHVQEAGETNGGNAVLEAIRHRRSIGKVKTDPVDRAAIDAMLDAAVWAPNHYHTEPWRFYVMTGEGRRVLGKAYADIAAEEAQTLSEEELAELRARQEAKAFRAPVVIAVAVSPSSGPKVLRTEEFAAVHAAVQNMLLAAYALGLGAMWRTGDAAYHPLMREAFGLTGDEQLVGFIFVGYPDMTPHHAKRTPAAAKTVWLDGSDGTQ